MKTIKNAYEDLNGDIENTMFHNGTEATLSYNVRQLEYVTGHRTESNSSFQYICTVEEFNNYKPETEQENEAVKNNREKNMIDWKEAPKEATHHGQSGEYKSFYRVNGCEVRKLDKGEWVVSIFSCADIEGKNSRANWHFTPRPKAEQENEAVKNPKHYQIFDGVESIEVIACSLTSEQWKGFCLGNILKYRIRAGKKDKLQQDIDKANYYGELHEKYKHLCRKG